MYFRMCTYSFLSAGSMKEFFSNTHCESLAKLLEVRHKILRTTLHLTPRGLLEFKTCPPWASSNSSLQFRLCYSGTIFCRGFCSWISAPVSYSPICLSVSPIWGAKICLVTSLLGQIEEDFKSVLIIQCLFVVCRAATSKFLTQRSRNWRSRLG